MKLEINSLKEVHWMANNICGQGKIAKKVNENNDYFLGDFSDCNWISENRGMF